MDTGLKSLRTPERPRTKPTLTGPRAFVFEGRTVWAKHAGELSLKELPRSRVFYEEGGNYVLVPVERANRRPVYLVGKDIQDPRLRQELRALGGYHG